MLSVICQAESEDSLDLKQQFSRVLDNKCLPQGFNLQWFGAEDEGRTEDPTDHKVRKAREEGKVAKSTDLVSAIVLLFCVLGLWMLAKYMFDGLSKSMKYWFSEAGNLNPSTDINIFQTVIVSTLQIATPMIMIAFVAAIMANVLQVGFMFTVKPLKPDFKKIAPRFDKFFKKAFFSGEALFNLLKALVKVAVIGMVAVLNILGEFENIKYFNVMPIPQSVGVITDLALRIMIEASIALIAFALPDYFFQRHKHKESLKMTKQEVKEERKTMEGDPLVKGRMRDRMREILSGNMMQNVAEADVVITNPTHYAVALQWNKESMLAPVMTAKGHDEIALSIKSRARENDVPIVENKPLARALYAEMELGDEIPEKFYETVSIILAEIYSMQGNMDEVV